MKINYILAGNSGLLQAGVEVNNEIEQQVKNI
jgi:hypothetical protein